AAGGTVLGDRPGGGTAAARAPGGEAGRGDPVRRQRGSGGAGGLVRARGAVGVRLTWLKAAARGRAHAPPMIPIARYGAGLRRIRRLPGLLLFAAHVLVEQRSLFPRGSAERALMVQRPLWSGLALFALAPARVLPRLPRGP